jgi:putative GTP pyrophosphokinase
VITLYETDIPKIHEIIKDNFDIISMTDKTKNLLSNPKEFGYKGLHIDLKLKNDRLSLPEYSRFKDVSVELQIRSIVQDAWSEVEHKLRYKRQSPPTMQRRIMRLAALFELADQEFSHLHEETKQLEQQAEQEAKSQRKENGEYTNGDTINAFSFLAIMRRLHPNYKFEPEAIDGFLDEIKSMDPDITTERLNQAIRSFRDKIWKYKQYQRKRDVNINPFTEIRHVLYAFDSKKFAEMLYPHQRAGLTEWLHDKDGNSTEKQGETARIKSTTMSGIKSP